MSRLTNRDFLRIKALTAKHKTAAEISQEVGFSEKTVKQARAVSSYYDYQKRYCWPKRKRYDNRNIIMTPVKPERPRKDKVVVLKPRQTTVLPQSGNEWKKVAIAFMAITTAILVAFVAVETLIILYFWSNYVV